MKNRLTFILLIAALSLTMILYGAIDSRVNYNQGVEAFKSGNYSSAELLFRKTLENDDDYRDRAWFYLSRTIYQQGKYKAAIFEFNSFLTKCRTEALRIESRFWMAESYYNLNDSLKAIEEYNRFIEKAEDIPQIIISHDRIATIYFNQKRYEEAIIEWEKSIKISSDMDQNAQMVLKIGRALFRNQEYDKSLERILPLLSARINSQNKAEIRLLVGRIYQLQNDDKKALTTFNAIPRELTETFPFYDMYYFRALSYQKLEKHGLAKSDLELFYLIGKKSEYYADGMFELGKILLSGSKPESGIEILNSIWESSENEEFAVKSGLMIAEFYLDNEPEKSIKYIEKYISIEDEDLKKNILLMLAKSYIKTRKFDKAETIIHIYSEKFPYAQEIDEINFMKGMIYLEKGNLDLALEIFNAIKKDNPFSKFNNDTDYYMALISYKKGRLDEAADLLRNYTSKKNVNNLFDAHLLLTDIYFFNGDLKKAEKEVNILITKYPDHSNVDRMVYELAKKTFEKTPGLTQNYFNILQYKYPSSPYTAMINMIYGNSNFEKKNYDKAINYYEKFLNGNVETNKGIAYYNLLLSNYHLKRYERVVEIIKSVKIPVLDENQWREIPLIHARCQYHLKNFEEVYNILRWENISTFNDEDIKIFIESTIKTGDIQTALKQIDNLKEKEHIQIEMMLLIAEYYESNHNMESAKKIYNSIQTSGTDDIIKEKARIELAKIYADTGNYDSSLIMLNQVELKENVPERDSLIIINHFYNGQEKRGAEITGSRLNYILNNRFTEKVLLLNMAYYYNQKNIVLFNKYVKLLNPYKQNTEYINYLSGKLYYETGMYKQSYLNFYKLSLNENIYTTETNYYLGKLNLLYNNNRNSSIKYFKKSIEDKNINNEFSLKSKIELAIIFHEMKDYKGSENLLTEIIKENEKGRYNIQAQNLFEDYFPK